MARVLSIAGSDPSGGAGIQADLKTLSAYSVYGMTAITALTVQNTEGVARVEVMVPDLVREQILAAVEDIGVDAIKIGMLGDAAVVKAVSDTLRDLPAVPIVLDPVMVATSGDRLLTREAEEILIRDLLPQAEVVTPNLPEASVLSGMAVTDAASMVQGASRIAEFGVPYVLIKGGHLNDDTAADLLMHDHQPKWFSAPRIHTNNTHGTGCTLSSAIAAGLAEGLSVKVAVQKAKQFVTQALLGAPELGHGHGPLWHHAQGGDHG